MGGSAHAAVQALLAAIASARSVTDEQLSMLNFIFEKNLERALRVLDQGGVHRVVAQPSDRSVFQVIGESRTGPNSYLCFPEHFCSCQSFFFDVVSRSDQLCCKHQLAAMLGSALHQCRDVIVSDAELARKLAIDGLTVSSQEVSFSKAIVADTPSRKAESLLEENSSTTYKWKVDGNPAETLQLIVQAGEKKKRKTSQVDRAVAADMEDLCSLVGSQGDLAFSRSEGMAIRTSLLHWYDRNHRVLPWRINRHSCVQSPLGADEPDEPHECHKEPIITEVKKEASHFCVSNDVATETEGERAYAVWVSEIMLQQTRVATVISYYQRWMNTWPTVRALARASQEDVNTVWAGLGYYRRARFLLEGAKYIVQDLRGKFPRSVEELLKVPGIGSYTAGAIASIAFQQAVPVVDGNVIRVLCRLRAITLNPKASTTVKLFWALASQLVDQGRPGDLNQALMELGATVCTPTSPSCTACPVSSQCTALKLVHQDEKKLTPVTHYPTRVPKSAPRDEYVAVCIVERELQTKMAAAASSVLLVRRPLTGLLAGLWEFPSAPLDNPDSSEKSRSTAMDEYLHDTLGVELRTGSYSILKREEFGTYVHVFSHIRLHMFIQWVLVSVEGEGRSTRRRQNSVVTKWVDLDSMNSLGLTSGVKKVFKMFLALREKQRTASKSTKRKRT